MPGYAPAMLEGHPPAWPYGQYFGLPSTFCPDQCYAGSLLTTHLVAQCSTYVCAHAYGPYRQHAPCNKSAFKGKTLCHHAFQKCPIIQNIRTVAWLIISRCAEALLNFSSSGRKWAFHVILHRALSLDNKNTSKKLVCSIFHKQISKPFTKAVNTICSDFLDNKVQQLEVS